MSCRFPSSAQVEPDGDENRAAIGETEPRFRLKLKRVHVDERSAIGAAKSESPPIPLSHRQCGSCRRDRGIHPSRCHIECRKRVRHSYKDGVAFFVRDFGTDGMNKSYTFRGLGKRRAEVREHATQPAEDGQNLERLKEAVAVEVEHSCNKLERTKSMVNVAMQVAKLREESDCLTTEQAARGVVLVSYGKPPPPTTRPKQNECRPGLDTCWRWRSSNAP